MHSSVRCIIMTAAALALLQAQPSSCFLVTPNAAHGLPRRLDHPGRYQRPGHREPAVTRVAARFVGDQRYSLDTVDNACPPSETKLLSRKDMIWLLAAGSAMLVAPASTHAECSCSPGGCSCAQESAKPVVVIGAAGGTGGETVRALLRRKNTPVVASTRRPVTLAIRDTLMAEGKGQKPLSKDTLLLQTKADEARVRRVIADAVKPETLPNALEGAGAVIYCAGTRPKVDVTTTPGTKPGGQTSDEQGTAQVRGASYYSRLADTEGASSSANADYAGLVNVAKECVRQGIPKLIIVSSICAKCQRGGSESEDGEQIDRGTASCDTCYAKQDAEKLVRNLYAGAPAGVTYTIVRPGLLSRGEVRGPSSVEFNQGISKSGIISRADLAEVLVGAATSDAAGGKSFEVYYSDTAQPIDMYASLQSCKGLGKSVKECFFGKGFDDSAPVSLDEVLKKPLQGSLFATGAEVQGTAYPEMFVRLAKDSAEPFDLNSLASPSVL